MVPSCYSQILEYITCWVFEVKSSKRPIHVFLKMSRQYQVQRLSDPEMSSPVSCVIKCVTFWVFQPNAMHIYVERKPI
jgi:hypothetical protein